VITRLVLFVAAVVLSGCATAPSRKPMPPVTSPQTSSIPRKSDASLPDAGVQAVAQPTAEQSTPKGPETRPPALLKVTTPAMSQADAQRRCDGLAETARRLYFGIAQYAPTTRTLESAIAACADDEAEHTALRLYQTHLYLVNESPARAKVLLSEMEPTVGASSLGGSAKDQLTVLMHCRAFPRALARYGMVQLTLDANRDRDLRAQLTELMTHSPCIQLRLFAQRTHAALPAAP
jgi:hypothetical protein